MTIFHMGSEIFDPGKIGSGITYGEYGGLEGGPLGNMLVNARTFLNCYSENNRNVLSFSNDAVLASTSTSGLWIHYRSTREDGTSTAYSSGGTLAIAGTDWDNARITENSRGFYYERNSTTGYVYNSETDSYDTVLGKSYAGTVDIHVRLDAVDGFVRVYYDNILKYGRSGSVLMGSSDITGSQIRAIYMGAADYIASNNGQYYINEVVIADEDTRYSKVYPLTYDIDGRFSDYEGDLSDVNGVSETGSQIIMSGLESTATFKDSPKLNLNLNSDEYVRAVQTNVRATAEPGFDVRLDHVFDDSDGTGITEAGIGRLIPFDSAGIGQYSWIFDNNPATGSGWVESDFEVYDFGFRTKALA